MVMTGSSITIGILGAGTMGVQIAALFSLCGHKVIVFDTCPPIEFDTRFSRAQRLLKRSATMASLIATEASLCKLAPELKDLKDATLVIECVTEDLHIKQDLLVAVASIVASSAIIVTNTSSLSIEELARTIPNENRFMGAHFFNPISAVPLVELCATRHTDANSIEYVQNLLASAGRTVVAVPDTPGFVVNRLLFLMIAEAARMIDESGIEPASLDRAMRTGANMPMGPLELADLIGLDVCASILDSLHLRTGDRIYITPTCIREHIRNGSLGRKTGRGFYGKATI